MSGMEQKSDKCNERAKCGAEGPHKGTMNERREISLACERIM